jgi:hypothetical protein
MAPKQRAASAPMRQRTSGGPGRLDRVRWSLAVTGLWSGSVAPVSLLAPAASWGGRSVWLGPGPPKLAPAVDPSPVALAGARLAGAVVEGDAAAGEEVEVEALDEPATVVVVGAWVVGTSVLVVVGSDGMVI